ncbi:MAG: nucleotide exchange factor GrpE [candidate division Zixibacteria bacterium]|nr:nucleotide exchange factor GrpE [candidate division Zixibacteria bacterium]
MTKNKKEKKKPEHKENNKPKEKPGAHKNSDNIEYPVVDIEKSEEYQQLNDRYLRLAAEFENYKKRTAREYSRLTETAESSLIFQLLEVVDDFDRALHQDTDDIKTLKQGIEMILNKLKETLRKRGLKEIKAVDEEFDPVYHEAVMQKEVSDKDDGIIVEELQKGYFHNSRVLRPAKVIVAKKIIESSGDNNKDDNSD